MEKHFLLFSGHMIDRPGRTEARFPARKEMSARKAIEKKVTKLKQREGFKLIGIAGGACGGDILFHEVCMAQGVPTEIYLALPPKQFIEKSVSFAGEDWVRRFNRLLKQLPFHILSEEIDAKKVWKKANSEMLAQSLREGGTHMTLLALWDGKEGDGDGGTEDMIKEAHAANADVVIIYMNQLL